MNRRILAASLCATPLAVFAFQQAVEKSAAAESTFSGRSPAAAPQAMSEIRALFAEYLKLHAAKEMDKWKELFLPEANCVSTLPDGSVNIYTVAQLAQRIAEEAKTVNVQQLTFEDTHIEVHANAAHYSASWILRHDGKVVRQGRSFFSLVKKEGTWRIAAFVWHRD